MIATRDETGRRGHAAAPGAADWLSLAAMPTFAVMALWTGFFNGQPDMFCVGMQNAPPLNGMALMYGLMSAFHSAPWLRLFSYRPSAVRR
jgi:hypothetical protein